MMKPSVIFLMTLLMFVTSLSNAQKLQLQGEVNTSSIITGNNQMPFWFWANQLGQIPENAEFIQTGELNLNPELIFNNNNKIFAGGHLFGYTGSGNEFIITELFAGFNMGKLEAWIGSRADPLIQSGLSSSNGNLLNSRNARPYPKISLGTNEFIKIGKGNFYVAGRWEEGILFDDRWIEKPRLHHKNLFLRGGAVEKLQFDFGIDHYAFWGGTSDETGPQPKSFSDYLRAVFAKKGGAEHTASDQANVAGNSLGQYFFIFRKDLPKVTTEFRIIHPFEDKSGMVMFNGIDNLYSLYLSFKDRKFIQHALFEFVYTKNQSGDDKRTPDGTYIHTNGHDNYLNHGFYKSGFTYFGKVMGSPFFYPVSFNESGISTGIRNTRFIALHGAADGQLSNSLKWRSMLSCSFNYGNYESEFDPPRKQVSGLFEMIFNSVNFPLYITGRLALDYGSNSNDGLNKLNSGFQLILGKKIITSD